MPDANLRLYTIVAYSCNAFLSRKHFELAVHTRQAYPVLQLIIKRTIQVLKYARIAIDTCMMFRADSLSSVAKRTQHATTESYPGKTAW